MGDGTTVYDVDHYATLTSDCIDGLGAGDSRLLLNVLPKSLADRALADLKSEVQWLTMQHRGGDVPRLISVQGDLHDGIEPCTFARLRRRLTLLNALA